MPSLPPRPLSPDARNARRVKRVALLDRRIATLVGGPHGSDHLSTPEVAQLQRLTQRKARHAGGS